MSIRARESLFPLCAQCVVRIVRHIVRQGAAVGAGACMQDDQDDDAPACQVACEYKDLLPPLESLYRGFT